MANWQALEQTWNQGSFVTPVPAPNAEPGAAPTVCVQFAAAWLPYVLGGLYQLTQPSAWDPASPGFAAAQGQAQGLMAIFSEAGVCTDMLQFQFTDTCGLQYSIDGGTSWIDVPGWDTFAPSCFTGPTGPAGPAGPSPTFRLNGCQLQFSLDGGATWINVSGFDAYPDTCISPSAPPNPTGAGVNQAACNIAEFLTTELIQGAITSAVTSFNDDLTLAVSVAAILALIPGWGTALAAGIEAGAGLARIIDSGNLAAFTTASTSATLHADLLCAIYSAISTDGEVTEANFAAVAAAIHAVAWSPSSVQSAIDTFVTNLGATGMIQAQMLGGTVVGNCSACSSPPVGCAPLHADVIGSNVAHWQETGVTASLLTMGATSEYAGVVANTAVPTSTISSLKFVAPAAGHAFGSVFWFTAPTLPAGGPNGGDNAWTNALDLELRVEGAAWSLNSFGSVLASGGGISPGDIIELRLNVGQTSYDALQNGSSIYHSTGIGPAGYKPGALGFFAGETFDGIQLCVGS